MKKYKKPLLIALVVLDVAVITFFLVLSIMILVTVTKYNTDGTTETRTTKCNSNVSVGWPELSVWAWEHWQYQFFSKGTVYLDGKLRQNGSDGYFAHYDSGDSAKHSHTVEVLLKM